MLGVMERELVLRWPVAECRQRNPNVQNRKLFSSWQRCVNLSARAGNKISCV
jgi:hypothetical protein